MSITYKSVFHIILYGFVTIICINCDGEEGYYTIIAPKVIYSNIIINQYMLAVSTHGTTKTFSATIGFEKNNPNGSNVFISDIVNIEPNMTTIMKLRLGNFKDGTYKLKAESTSSIKFKQEVELNVKSKFFITILTDKTIYQHADTVRFQIFVLDLSIHQAIYLNNFVLTVNLYNPLGVLQKSWKTNYSEASIYTNEYYLNATSDVYGLWEIEAETMGMTSKEKFEVYRFISPKFRVNIDTLTNINKNDEIIAKIQALYSNKKAVSGTAVVTIYPRNDENSYTLKPVAQKIVKLNILTGIAVTKFNITEKLNFQTSTFNEFVIEVVVKDQWTKANETQTSFLKINNIKDNIKIIKTSEFKPGQLFSAQIQATHFDDSPVIDNNNPMILTTSFYTAKENVSDVKTSVFLDKNGMANIDLDIPENIKQLHIRVSYKDLEKKYIEPPEPRLELIINTINPIQRKFVTVTVKCSEIMTSFTYLIISRGKICLSDTIRVSNRKSETFQFLADVIMSPKSNIIVYFIDPYSGRMIKNSTVLEFNSHYENYLELELSKTEVQPGGELNITIRTKANSFVSIMAIRSDVKSGILALEDKIDKEMENIIAIQHDNPWKSFQRFGTIVMTNAQEPNENVDKLETLIEKEMPREFLSRRDFIRPNFANVRKNYQHVWIWETFQNIGRNGKLVLHKTVPDEIGTWIITGYSFDKEGLVFIKSPVELKVLHRFYITTNVPAIVKRDEIISIPVHIINYMTENITVDVILENLEKSFEIVTFDGKRSNLQSYQTKEVYSISNSGTTMAFFIRPTSIGEIKIKVTAISPLATDHAEWSLLVEPEGTTRLIENTVVFHFVNNTKIDKEVILEIPENAISGSIHIKLLLQADILNSSLLNIEKVVQFESDFSAEEDDSREETKENIAVFLIEKVLQNTIYNYLIKIDFNRIIHIAVWHPSELENSQLENGSVLGNTWMTAFIIHSYLRSRMLLLPTTSNNQLVEKSLDWLTEIQEDNGNIPEVSIIFDDLSKDLRCSSFTKSNVKDIALTAFTLITFLKNDRTKYEEVILKGTDFIAKKLRNIEDVYVLSLVTYVLQLAGHNAKDDAKEIFDSKATTIGQRKWWFDKNNPDSSVTVETTAYGLLIYLAAGNLSESVEILNWLLEQWDEKNGYPSEQSFIVALIALGDFADKTYLENDSSAKITINSINGELEKKIQYTHRNSKEQTFDLPASVRNISLSGVGQGFFFVKFLYEFNINEVTEKTPSFLININATKSTEKILSLSICASFNSPENALSQFYPIANSSIIMEIEFPTGFTVDLDSANELKEISEKIERVEFKKHNSLLVILFGNFENECLLLNSISSFKIANQKPSSVIIYDKRNRTRRTVALYKIDQTTICDICSEEECTDYCYLRNKGPDNKNAATNIQINEKSVEQLNKNLATRFYDPDKIVNVSNQQNENRSDKPDVQPKTTLLPIINETKTIAPLNDEFLKTENDLNTSSSGLNDEKKVSFPFGSKEYEPKIVLEPLSDTSQWDINALLDEIRKLQKSNSNISGKNESINPNKNCKIDVEIENSSNVKLIFCSTCSTS